jgi:CheY-like chemotaxis protein
MSWQPQNEGDRDSVMARPAIFGHELGAVRDRTEALLDGFDYETTFLESHFVNDHSLEATQDGLAASDEAVLWQNEELMRLRSELQAERRKNEELKAKIEARVRRRSVELYQVLQLKDELLVREQRARSEAEAANRNKDEFLAFVAHELRTPLSAILGWAQLMRSKTGDDDKRARAAEVIERSALDQARIINDILDVSRIVTGNLQPDLRSLELASVVQAAIEAARPAIDVKGIHLEIHSEGEGKGSTFTMNLPLDTASRVESNVLVTESRVVHARNERLEGLWVWVVDDDSDSRELMRAVLEASGARVTTCGSCEDALGLLSDKATFALRRRRPDLIVADLAMPGQDGFDLIRALRSLEATRGGAIPALAVSGFAGEEARAQSLAAGYQEHLTKPVPVDELVAAIARLVGSSS